MRVVAFALVLGLAVLGWRAPVLAGIGTQADRDAPLDRILDTYVRDGLVYYHALQVERAPLDRYVASLDLPAAELAGWSRERQMAFWLNAYDALVLRTVVNAYPIHGGMPDYPENSIRQIPGAFELVRHRVAGRDLTLDEIEQTLIGFGDARVVLAMGRGAIGSGRLRSEVFRAADLGRQLTEAVKECAARVDCVKVDRAAGAVEVTPLIGWHPDVFVKTFAARGVQWSNRSPIERAVLGMVHPYLFQSEREFLALNNFVVRYSDFDWHLNLRGSGLFSTDSAVSVPGLGFGDLAPNPPNLWKTDPTP